MANDNYNLSTCGYQGHYCAGVKFISRYCLENDYCINGTRVHLRDTGEFNGTKEQLDAVFLYELQKYACYLDWRAAMPQCYRETSPLPFEIERFASLFGGAQ